MPVSDSSPKRSRTRWRSWLTLSSAGVDAPRRPGRGPARAAGARRRWPRPPGARRWGGAGGCPRSGARGRPGGRRGRRAGPGGPGPAGRRWRAGPPRPGPRRPGRAPGPPAPGPDPGRPTTSATSVSSDGGMLSITYQPGVLEGGRRRGASRPRHAGDQEVVAHGSPSPHASRALPVRPPAVRDRAASILAQTGATA